jgi:UDP-glucose 4-epimerase
MSRILITGASGFVGRTLTTELANAGHAVRAAMRQPADVFPRSVEVVAVSDLTRPVEWRPLLRGMEIVVHLAGIAHAGPGIAEDAYDRVNRQATVELAHAAKAVGVRHLVFVSSIRAQTGPSSPTVQTETTPPQPTDAYGRSKLAAEEAIRASGIPFTILRPVVIYGSDVKGNLARLVQITRKPWPLPFGLCRNRRSLLARQNLVEAIHLVLQTPSAQGETYVVADPTPLTFAEMIAALRAGHGRAAGLFPVPPTLFAMAFRAIGRGEEWDRIGGGLVADPSKLLRAGWTPTVETRAGLAALAQVTGDASHSVRA